MASKQQSKPTKRVEGSKQPRTETYTYSASSYRARSYEDDLFELVQLSDVPLDKELSKEILELLKMNIAPAAILQVLKMLKSRASSDVTATQDQDRVVNAGDQTQASVTPREKVTQTDRESKSSRSKSGRASDKISRSSSKRSSEHKRQQQHGSKHKDIPVNKSEKSAVFLTNLGKCQLKMQGTFGEFEPYILSGIQVTERELGRGSYASVVEIDYRGLKCAGKKIYQTLSQQGDSYSLRRFAEECRLLNQMRHPNVVQFLGVHFERQVTIPILVMEYLPTNLSSCIDKYGILPEDVNYSILHDMSLGLSYLHNQTPPIIHRDLSANNVLLTSNMTAKISDLGVAKILNLTPLQMSRMTETPGTPTYMPPEVMVVDPKYNTSVDIFSYGIMMIHVFSGKWPHPKTGQTRTEADGRLVPVSEAERREEYLRELGPDHPLMDLILKCISNHPPRRGDSSEIVQRLKDAVTRFPPGFANKVEMLSRIEALEQEKRDLINDSEQKDEEIALEQKRVNDMEEEITDLKAQHQRTLESVELACSTEVKQLQSEVRGVTAQLEMITSEKQAIKLENESFTNAMDRERQAFSIASEIQKEIFKTENQALQQSIEELTDDIQRLQSELDAVKLQSRSDIANLKVKNSKMKATLTSKELELAAMTATLKRKDSEIVSKEIALTQKDDRIKFLNDQLTSTREHLSSKLQSMQATKITWKQCTDLPMIASSGHAITINNKVYYGGFFAESAELRRTIYCYDPSNDTWSSLPPLLVEHFGLGQVKGQLVAVGGYPVYWTGFFGILSDHRKVLDAMVHVFDNSSKKWNQPFPPMPTARNSPTVISHPSALIVAGGCTSQLPYGQYDVFTDVVEIFNIETSEWFRVDSLPVPCRSMIPAIVNNTCYLIGGYNRPNKLNQVLCASVDQLLHKDHNATPLNQASLHGTANTQDHVSVWKQLANTPAYRPTAAVMGDTVLSIGGSHSSKDDRENEQLQSAVYRYSPSTDSWTCIADPLAPLLNACTALLSPTEILVIGGHIGKSRTKTVYKGTLTVTTAY